VQHVSVAIIGYGYWGPNIARNFGAHQHVTVAAICDAAPRRLESAKRHHPEARMTSDLADVLNDEGIDAIAIATPISTHFHIAKQALEAGKHVLVEKPITRTSAEADVLIQLAKEKKRILMVGHTFAYTGAVACMKGLVAKGELGPLYYFDSERLNLGLLQKDANVLWDLAPHDLSILLSLIPEDPVSVHAFAHAHVGTQQEFAVLELRYASGFHAHIRVSWISPVKIRRTLLAGERKMVVFDDVEPSEKIRVYDCGVTLGGQEVSAFNPLYRAGDIVIPALDRTEALFRETEHFVQCIRTGGVPRTSGEEGRRVVRILEAADRSIASNGLPIDLI
jgi:predicted dehydrogenase